MCSIVLAFKTDPERPFVMGANRDENLDRPALGTAIWEIDGTTILAPRDQVAGGTWIGINQKGLVAAVTNRFGESRDPTLKSRGDLVTLALEHRSAEEARGWAKQLMAEEFNPFHLLVADLYGGFIVVGRHQSQTMVDLIPGVYVLTERSHAGTEVPRERVFSEAFQQDLPTLSELKTLMSQHKRLSLDSPSVEIPDFNYGTRSSWVLDLRGPESGNSELWTTEKRPTPEGYVDRSKELRAFLVS